MSFLAVVSGDTAEAQVKPAKYVGVDGQLPGDHEPGRKRTGLVDGVKLARSRHLVEAACPLGLGAEGLRGLHR